MGKCIKCGKKAGFLKSECDECKTVKQEQSKKPIIAKFFGYHPNDNKYGIAVEVITVEEPNTSLLREREDDTPFLYDWLLSMESCPPLLPGDYVTFDDVGHHDGRGVGKNVVSADFLIEAYAAEYGGSKEMIIKIWDIEYNCAKDKSIFRNLT